MWWKTYGFSENPLDIRPNDNVLGLENIEKEIINAIENGEIFLLYGPIGCGKTSLALKISKILKNKYIFIYLNGEENPNPNIKELYERYIYKKILFFKLKENKPVVFILDELQNFSEEVIKCIKAMYDSKKIHAVFLIQVSENIKNAPPSFINRIYRRIFIDFPDEETIIKIIETRLQGKIKFDHEFLREIIKLNNRNVRSILIEISNILEKLNHPIKDVIKKDTINKIEILEDESSIEDVKVSPQQLIILEKLLGRKLTIKQISELTNIPYNTVSKQVSRLAEKGILVKEEINKKIYYSISPKYIKAIMKKIGR